MNILKTSRLSCITIGIIVLSIIFFRFQETPRNDLSWDTFGYYLYLPAKFIYNDPALLQQDWLNTIIEKYETTATFYQGYKMDNGNWIIKYTMGLAILWTPFFFLADFIAPILGYEADGFSVPYQVSLILGTIFYFIIGLIYMLKVLRHFFSDQVTAITLLLITLGTNYFQLAYLGTLLSHVVLFGGYSALLWYTIKWHEKPKLKYAVLIGLICGFTTLARPSEMTSILIPLLWGIHSKESFLQKIKLIKENLSHVGLLIVATILAGSPQLFYWKAMTGSWVYYSYDNPGEGFEFLSPYTFQYLFSFRKGWLIYTPIIAFGLAGLIYLYKVKREIFLALSIFMVAEIWFCSSWSTWWYAGGSYSARAMVSSYAVVAVGLGFTIQYFFQLSKTLRATTFGILGLLFILNLFQTWQYQAGVIDAQRMTMAYYFKIFGRTTVDEEDKKLLLVERAVVAYEHLKDPENYDAKQIGYFSFDEENVQDTNYQHLGNVLAMGEDRQFSPGIEISFEDITDHYYAWIKSEVDVFIPNEYEGEMPMLTVHFTHDGKAYKYRTVARPQDQVKKGQWQKLSMDYMTPEVRNSIDKLKVYIWQRGKGRIFIDNLKIEAYEPKNR